MQGGTMRLSRAGAGSLTLTRPSVLREGGISPHHPTSYDPAAQYEVHFLQGVGVPRLIGGTYAGAST
jgi:hypothetical protein